MVGHPSFLPEGEAGERLLNDPSLHARVTALLAGTPMFFSLPESLRDVFAHYRQRDFARYIRLGAPAALLMCALIISFGYWSFGALITEREGRLWWLSAVGSFAILTVAWISYLAWPALARHYTWSVGLTGAAIIGLLTYVCNALIVPQLSQSLTYAIVFVLMVVASAVRLSVPWVLLTALGGAILGLGATLLAGDVPDWKMWVHYYGGSLLIGVFISWMLERQEKFNLMQALLLIAEAAERSRLNEELERIACEDVLSGLANRRYFDDALSAEWDRMQREQRPLAILFVDVDHFKRYNDHFGHQQGDQCLAAVGQALRTCLNRPGDLAARYGGEEFVLMLPGTSQSGASDVASRALSVVDALKIPHPASETASNVTISIGVAAMVPNALLNARDLVEAADMALYQAKRCGRHQFQPVPQSA